MKKTDVKCQCDWPEYIDVEKLGWKLKSGGKDYAVDRADRQIAKKVNEIIDYLERIKDK